MNKNYKANKIIFCRSPSILQLRTQAADQTMRKVSGNLGLFRNPDFRVGSFSLSCSPWRLPLLHVSYTALHRPAWRVTENGFMKFPEQNNHFFLFSMQYSQKARERERRKKGNLHTQIIWWFCENSNSSPLWRVYLKKWLLQMDEALCRWCLYSKGQVALIPRLTWLMLEEKSLGWICEGHNLTTHRETHLKLFLARFSIPPRKIP